MQCHACTVWTSAATKLLIDIVRENMYDDQDRKLICHNGMWKWIDDILKLNGYIFTPEQLRGRWKTLVYSYKQVIPVNRSKTTTTNLAKALENMNLLPIWPS